MLCLCRASSIKQITGTHTKVRVITALLKAYRWIVIAMAIQLQDGLQG